MVACDPGRARASVISAAQSLIGPLSCIVVNRVESSRMPAGRSGRCRWCAWRLGMRMGGTARPQALGFDHDPAQRGWLPGQGVNVVPVSRRIGSPRRSARPWALGRGEGPNCAIASRVQHTVAAEYRQRLCGRRWRGRIDVIGAQREPVVEAEGRDMASPLVRGAGYLARLARLLSGLRHRPVCDRRKPGAIVTRRFPDFDKPRQQSSLGRVRRPAARRRRPQPRHAAYRARRRRAATDR